MSTVYCPRCGGEEFVREPALIDVTIVGAEMVRGDGSSYLIDTRLEITFDAHATIPHDCRKAER